MPMYRVNITDTFLIQADDPDEAEDKALEIRSLGNLSEPAVSVEECDE